MKITAYKVSNDAMELHPSSNKRKWMDETPDKFAYRCLPLQIANASGWVLLNPCDLIISWNGGNRKDDLTIHIARSDMNYGGCPFGYGIVTFHPGYIFRTTDNYDLLMTGPPNYFYDFMSPLTGIVETFWLPFTTTMNWKLNRPGTFEIKKNDPLAFIMPIPHLFPDIEAETKDIRHDPELMQTFNTWAHDRTKLSEALDHLEKTGQGINGIDPTDPSTTWERTYFQGKTKDGKDIDAHATKVRMPKFKLVV